MFVNNVLPFGWKISPYACHTLGMVATQELLLAAHTLFQYIDDCHLGQCRFLRKVGLPISTEFLDTYVPSSFVCASQPVSIAISVFRNVIYSKNEYWPDQGNAISPACPDPRSTSRVRKFCLSVSGPLYRTYETDDIHLSCFVGNGTDSNVILCMIMLIVRCKLTHGVLRFIYFDLLAWCLVYDFLLLHVPIACVRTTTFSVFFNSVVLFVGLCCFRNWELMGEFLSSLIKSLRLIALGSVWLIV